MKLLCLAALTAVVGCGLTLADTPADFSLQRRGPVFFPEAQGLAKRATESDTAASGSQKDEATAATSAPASKATSDSNSKSTAPSKTTGKDTASATEDQSSEDTSSEDDSSDETADDVGRVNMIIPPYPTGVATPRFQLDSQNITFEWKYTGLSSPPDSITITVSMPAPDKANALVYFDLATNISSSETKLEWDTTTTKPSTVALLESDQYTFMLYDSDLGKNQAQMNLGSLSQFNMKFAMYRSNYDDPNKCTQCIIANDNYSAAPSSRYASFLTAAGLVVLSSLGFSFIL
ncbi:hypothetical protein H4R33_004985 [Dimargaris cristalligena]|uniref:DUF7137 domain-containing protein n=1 Tax=Dimargaris cristalligena TaxID=215637 RepID=A0A4Q0A331_9FUNG|nr:hypothetical protein H4R33_004985 [Dimargaris cristalligena]RKP39961.1 hypothetical protein BJ085DRAFT_35190 [Dimargaris cristalligena]|eukprot:RKP39961.1 hypothetical protein BJ085DRAFT_35190 [Dimargaris cristalligena]